MTQNVFEFLGLPADHRKEGKVVQLVKHMDEVPAKKIKYPLMCQIKRDGVYCMVVANQGQVKAFGRTGKELQNCGPILSEFTGAVGDYIAIGELCCDKLSLEELSGVVNPNRKEPLSVEVAEKYIDHVKLYLHDTLYLSDFIRGEAARPYRERLAHLDGLMHDLYPSTDFRQTVHQHRVIKLISVYLFDLNEVERWAADMIEDGEEGIVLKQDLPWVAGHKGHHVMKRVRRVTYDLLCVGAEEGKGKRQGMVANLLFRWKGGKVIKADMGKGWTDEQRRWAWEDKSQVGFIFTVYGLMDSSKGVIRLPKVGELRHDKAEADY